MSAESQLSHQDQSPSPWVLTSHFWKPHHMDNGELCSGLLETHLKFRAYLIPVFWIQTRCVAWNTVFPTGKTLKCAEKGLLENINISYKDEQMRV